MNNISCNYWSSNTSTVVTRAFSMEGFILFSFSHAKKGSWYWLVCSACCIGTNTMTRPHNAMSHTFNWPLKLVHMHMHYILRIIRFLPIERISKLTAHQMWYFSKSLQHMMNDCGVLKETNSIHKKTLMVINMPRAVQNWNTKNIVWGNGTQRARKFIAQNCIIVYEAITK